MKQAAVAAKTETNPVVTSQTTEQLLAAALQEREQLFSRRENLERVVAETLAAADSLAPRIVAADADALNRSRALRAEVADVRIQIDSITLVEKSVGANIAQLDSVRRKEIEDQRYADANDRVATITAETTKEIRAFFEQIDAALDSYAKVDAGLRSLRVRQDESPYLARAVAGRDPLPQLEAQRREALDRLGLKRGGADNLTFPLWFLQTRQGII